MLKPNYYIDTVFDINFEVLKNININSILLDIDNTLVPFKTTDVDDKIGAWIRKAKDKGFKLCLVSNAYPRRAQMIGKNLEVPVIYMAKKPFKKGLVSGMALLGSDKSETIMVGDQLLTDILAARFAGIKSILVDPLTRSDFIMTKIYRVMEFFIKKNLHKEEMK